MKAPARLLSSSVVAFALALSSCGEKKAPSADPAAGNGEEEHKAITTEELEPYECGTIKRLHTLGGIFLASQPEPEDFEQAKKGGVKTVINIRHDSEIKDFNEKEVVEAQGLTYVHFPWNGPEELTDEIIDRGRDLLKTSEKSILLHCGSGNRVGAIWLPHRVLDGGISLDDAVAEAKIVGLKSADYERIAREYISKKQAKP